jgi:hypothetical protein
MVFKCQTDSFLKEFTTKVVKIEESEDKKLLVNFEVSFPSFSRFPDYFLQPPILSRTLFCSLKVVVNPQTTARSSCLKENSLKSQT